MKRKKLNNLSKDFLQILDLIYGELSNTQTKVLEGSLTNDEIKQEFAKDLTILALTLNCSKEELMRRFSTSKKRIAEKLKKS